MFLIWWYPQASKVLAAIGRSLQKCFPILAGFSGSNNSDFLLHYMHTRKPYICPAMRDSLVLATVPRIRDGILCSLWLAVNSITLSVRLERDTAAEPCSRRG
jgi:hypothetical protein